MSRAGLLPATSYPLPRRIGEADCFWLPWGRFIEEGASKKWALGILNSPAHRIWNIRRVLSFLEGKGSLWMRWWAIGGSIQVAVWALEASAQIMSEV